MKQKKITLLVLLLIFALHISVYAADSSQITINSKIFTGQKYSNTFHRTFCPKLFYMPQPISYVQCRKLGLKPCPDCIDKKLLSRLEQEYQLAEQQRQQQLQQERIAAQQARIRSQRLLKEKKHQLELKRQQIRKLKEQQRLKALEKQQRQAEQRAKQQRAARKAAQIQCEHEREIIRQRLTEVQINFIVTNSSGLKVPAGLFSTTKEIIGSLNCPIDINHIEYGYTIHCSDDHFHYRVTADKAKLLFKGKNLVSAPTIDIYAKHYDATDKSIIFEDANLKLVVHKISFRNQLSAIVSLRNKSERTLHIKSFNLRINSSTCAVQLSQVLSIAAKKSLRSKKLILELNVAAAGAPTVTKQLGSAVTLKELQHKSITIGADINYANHSSRSRMLPFNQRKRLKFGDLFKP